jgi:hypothetical protein
VLSRREAQCQYENTATTSSLKKEKNWKEKCHTLVAIGVYHLLSFEESWNLNAD